MNRSLSIYGKVLRNLGHHKDVTDVDLAYIYDEMNSAQQTIVSRIITQASFDITMVQNQIDYPLADLAEDSIRGIKDFIQPDEWDCPIVIVENSEWDEIIHSNITSTQPIYATIYNGVLKLYPVNNVDGEILETWVYLKAPLAIITELVEPEVSQIWDKAIEFYTTAQMLPPEQREYYLAKFEQEVSELETTDYTQKTNLTIKGTW